MCGRKYFYFEKRILKYLENWDENKNFLYLIFFTAITIYNTSYFFTVHWSVLLSVSISDTTHRNKESCSVDGREEEREREMERFCCQGAIAYHCYYWVVCLWMQKAEAVIKNFWSSKTGKTSFKSKFIFLLGSLSDIQVSQMPDKYEITKLRSTVYLVSVSSYETSLQPVL